MQAVTLFGSNSGQKLELVTKAIHQISAIGRIMLSSSFYETEPWGFESEEKFLNQITVFDTPLFPGDFLQFCLETEKKLGRVRHTGGPRYSSRPIDIDLLFYDSLIIETPTLILPHPRLHERNFTLIPLAEIMPDFIHPLSGRTISELLAESPDQLTVKKIRENIYS